MLELWTDSTLAMRRIGDSDDMDYGTASMIMSNLRLQKAGHLFDLVKIPLEIYPKGLLPSASGQNIRVEGQRLWCL